MAIGDVYSCRLEFSTNDVVWGVGLHYRADTALDDKDAAQDLLDPLNTMQATEIAACLASDTTVESAYVRRVVGGAGMPALFQHNDVTGGRPGNSLPANSPITISLQSSDPLSKRAGRINLSGISKDDTFEGNAIGDLVSIHLPALTTKLLQPLTGPSGSWAPVLLIRVRNGAPVDPPDVVPLTAVNIFPVFRTQARRKGLRRGTST